jgi:hypothetical protein
MSESKDPAGYDEIFKVPTGVMDLVRKSYDTRQRVLDWTLAIMIVTLIAFTFRAQLAAFYSSCTNANAGKTDLAPNMNVKEAVGKTGQKVENLYTYNMPPARKLIASRVGPSSVRVPLNPSTGPLYPDLQCLGE